MLLQRHVLSGRHKMTFLLFLHIKLAKNVIRLFWNGLPTCMQMCLRGGRETEFIWIFFLLSYPTIFSHCTLEW